MEAVPFTIDNIMMLSVVGGATTLAAACVAGYQSMAPTAQWYGKTFAGLGAGRKEMALTYDDGPNDPHTLRLLEVLAKHDVRATFFLIGRFVQRRPDIVRDLLQAGHAIGNHTYSHPFLTFETRVQVRIQLAECGRAVEDATGQSLKLFRPPFGARRPAVLRIAREMDFVPVMWNVTGYDWSATRPDDIERNVSRQVRGGDVILLHDGGHREFGTDRSHTVIATDRLISRYKDEGREFVTVPQMMGSSVEAGARVEEIEKV